MARSPYYDDTAARLQRVMGIPMGDGRVFKNGVVVSAGDAAAAAATSATAAANDAQVRTQAITPTAPGMPLVPGSQVSGLRPQVSPAIDVNAYSGSRYAPGGPITSGPGYTPGAGIDVTGYAGSRYDPAFGANNGIKPVDPARQFVEQQLLAMNGTQPGRTYTPSTLAHATTAQIQGELTALKPRNDFINDLTTRGATKAAAGAGFASYDEAAASLPAGTESDIAQDTKTGRWMVNKASPTKPAGGFATREEAVASLPAGSKAQIQQNSTTGKWVVQQQIGEEKATVGYKTPQEAQAQIPKGAQGTISQNASGNWVASYRPYVAQPPTKREFFENRDLYKAYGGDFGKMLRDFAKLGELPDTQKPDEPKEPAGRQLWHPSTWFNNGEIPTQPGAVTDYTQGGRTIRPPAAPAPAASAPVTVKTQAERDALPAGTRYTAPDGKTYTKK